MDKLVEKYAQDLLNVINYARSKRKYIFIIGNGGSATMSDHYAQDLLGKGYRAISLCNSGNITAIANDFGYQEIFSRQVKLLGNIGDVLISMSCSGTSSSVLNALLQAKTIGMKTFILPTNYDTSLKTAFTQDIHLQIFHKVYEML